ncbi:MAG: acyl-CoA oxidase, partial [Flavobacterium sp.]
MKNTKLQAFIPLFYLVWSDDLLTQKEFTTIQTFINDLTWLSPEEKLQLISRLDISNPPSRNELAQWKLDIENSIQNKED